MFDFIENYEENVEKIDYRNTSLEEFRSKVETQHRPVLIENCIDDFENDFKFSFKVKIFIHF